MLFRILSIHANTPPPSSCIYTYIHGELNTCMTWRMHVYYLTHSYMKDDTYVLVTYLYKYYDTFAQMCHFASMNVSCNTYA